MLSFEIPKLGRIAIYLDEQGLLDLIQALKRLPRDNDVDGWSLAGLGCTLADKTPYSDDAVTQVQLHFIPAP